MRILLIKTSSLGDIIHTYPALTDAMNRIPNLKVDWVVEEGFTDLPRLHPVICRVITLPWRRVRKQLWHPDAWKALKNFVAELKTEDYDLVIDAQGLLKSAVWTKFVNAPVAGLDKHSAREPLASHFYHNAYTVEWGQHAIDRIRMLFAQALHYELPDLSKVDYSLTLADEVDKRMDATPYWFFAHATTWESKHWPESYWHYLVSYAGKKRRQVWLSWHNEEEKERAERLARLTLHVRVLPQSDLTTLARTLAHAELVVGVDTGLTHLSAALHRPVVALYGSTEAGLTGVVGPHAKVLQADYACSPCLKEYCIETSETQPLPPCYQASLSPQRVIAAIEELLPLG